MTGYKEAMERAGARMADPTLCDPCWLGTCRSHSKEEMRQNREAVEDRLARVAMATELAWQRYKNEPAETRADRINEAVTLILSSEDDTPDDLFAAVKGMVLAALLGLLLWGSGMMAYRLVFGGWS